MKLISVFFQIFNISAFARVFCSCSFPSILLFILCFYMLLHSWLNAWAEVLKFSDKQFYTVISFIIFSSKIFLRSIFFQISGLVESKRIQKLLQNMEHSSTRLVISIRIQRHTQLFKKPCDITNFRVSNFWNLPRDPYRRIAWIFLSCFVHMLRSTRICIYPRRKIYGYRYREYLLVDNVDCRNRIRMDCVYDRVLFATQLSSRS